MMESVLSMDQNLPGMKVSVLPKKKSFSSTEEPVVPPTDIPVFGVKHETVPPDTVPPDTVPHDTVPSNEVTYTVLHGATNRGRDRLLDSYGYQYHRKMDKRRSTMITWRCMNTLTCKATVRVRNGKYIRGSQYHWCIPKPVMNHDDPSKAKTKPKKQTQADLRWKQFLKHMSLLLTMGYKMEKPAQWIAVDKLQEAVFNWQEVLGERNESISEEEDPDEPKNYNNDHDDHQDDQDDQDDHDDQLDDHDDQLDDHDDDDDANNDDGVQVHLQVHDDQSREFSCPGCDESTFSKELLEQHIQQKHANDIQINDLHGFETKYCETPRRHTADKTTYKCDKCQFTGKTRAHLKHHLKFHEPHSHQCDDCGKFFVHKTELRRHVVIHSVGKPFQCQYCSYKCKRVGNLRRHIRTVHNLEIDGNDPMIPIDDMDTDMEDVDSDQVKIELNHVDLPSDGSEFIIMQD